MILVTLGTQKQQFTRLLDYIEKLNIKDEIIVQAGHTKYQSKKMKIFDFVDYEKMDELVDKADVIITHGGTGSIIGPLKKGKTVIACARLSKYGEHVDDHQEQIIDVFYEEGYILKLDDDNKLENVLKESKKFKPKRFVSNTDKFIKNLEEEINNSKANKINNFFLSFIFLSIIMLTPIIIYIRGNKTISLIENRTLTQFPKLTLNSLKIGKYQDNLENALADQMLFSETLKKLGNKIKSFNRSIVNKIMFNGDDIIPLENGICRLGDNLIYCPKSFDYFEEQLNQNIETINDAINRNPDIEFSVFRIRTDEDIFINEELDDVLSNNLNTKYKSLSIINSYEDVKQYFFKSDHHWNYLGSYEGYKEIINFLGENVLMIPTKTTCFEDTRFVGSRVTLTGEKGISDEFCVYNFDYPKMNIKVYGPEKEYGMESRYLSGDYQKGESYSHYALFYGHGYGEVIFDNLGENNGKRLLMIVDSMSNPINKLIASSYKKTFSIDLRNYKEYLNKEFDLDEFIAENEIDQVLIVGNIRNLGGNEFIPYLK